MAEGEAGRQACGAEWRTNLLLVVKALHVVIGEVAAARVARIGGQTLLEFLPKPRARREAGTSSDRARKPSFAVRRAASVQQWLRRP